MQKDILIIKRAFKKRRRKKYWKTNQKDYFK